MYQRGYALWYLVYVQLYTRYIVQGRKRILKVVYYMVAYKTSTQIWCYIVQVWLVVLFFIVLESLLLYYFILYYFSVLFGSSILCHVIYIVILLFPLLCYCTS